MARDSDIDYVEPNYDLELSDGRLHYWEEPVEDSGAQTSQSYGAQPAARDLRLPKAHRRSRGWGTKIAILDTGVDGTHPALVGRVQLGYDYVDDDADPSDSGDGIDSDGDGLVDEGRGHGTAVAELAQLGERALRAWPLTGSASKSPKELYGASPRQALDRYQTLALWQRGRSICQLFACSPLRRAPPSSSPGF